DLPYVSAGGGPNRTTSVHGFFAMHHSTTASCERNHSMVSIKKDSTASSSGWPVWVEHTVINLSLMCNSLVKPALWHTLLSCDYLFKGTGVLTMQRGTTPPPAHHLRAPRA